MMYIFPHDLRLMFPTSTNINVATISPWQKPQYLVYVVNVYRRFLTNYGKLGP